MEIKALYKKFLKHKGISAPKNKVQSKKPITVSNVGLWDKSKKKVIVPSNRITMKGPKGEQDFFKRPVLATGLQSGKQVLMQPGGEYYFPEDKQVFEKRMQGGGQYAVGPYDEMMAPKQGNYLLPDINRPSYKDEFGGTRSEYKMGFNDNGKETLIPTVVQGKQLSEDEAVDNYYRTGLHMGKYDTVQDAENASALRTAKYNMLQDPVRFKMSEYVPNMQDGGTVQTNMLQPIKKDEESLPVILDSLFSQFQKTKQEFGVEPEGEEESIQLQKGALKYTPPASTTFLRTSPGGNAGYSDNARVVTPFTGMDDATRARLDAQKAEEARRKRSGVISQGTPETSYQKAKRKSSFVEQEKERTGSASPMSYALDLVNPATYAFAATDLVGNTGSAVKNVAQGNFQEAGSDLVDASMNALYLLPAVSPAKSAARFATTQTPLKNLYKINPLATNLNKYNRVVGREAVDDALETGLIRTKAPSNKVSPQEGLINLDRRGTTPYASFGEGPVSSKNVYAQNIVNRGDTPYIISTNRSMKPSTLGSHGKGSTLFPVDESGNYLQSFPANEAQIYGAQPNWLKGYRPINSLETPNRSSVPTTNPFQPYENITDAEMDDIYHAAVGNPYYSDAVQDAVNNWQEFKFVAPELSEAFNYPLRKEMLLTRRLKTPLEVDESGFVKNITNKPIAFSAGPGNNLLGENRVFFMAPEGTKVAPISRAASNVAMQRERELLFPSDARFKLLHSRKNPETGLEDYIVGLDTPAASSSKGFKSEIDWAKWNPETPKYPELMNEYNAIEESTKKAGTWMKNPDGSAFQGTPEQFVQQQSSYFKKAFPNILKDSKGNVLPVRHGSPNKFDEFKGDYFGSTTDMGDKGVGTYVSPLDYSKEYGDNIYELAVNTKNPLYASDFIPNDIPVSARAHLADRHLKFFHRDISPKLEGRVNRFLDNDLVIGDEFYPKINENAFEMVVPYSNRMKSLRGNIGFFDMTNPNIYKAVAPVGAGLGVGASQLQKKKKGMQMGGMSIPGVNGTVVANTNAPSLYKKYKRK